MRRRFLLFFFIALLFFFSCKHKKYTNEETAATATELPAEKKFTSFVDSLKRAENTDYQIVNEIRKYLAQRLDYGKSRDSLSETYHKIPWEKLSVFHCIELFEQNKLTGKCGFSSYLLAKLYDKAGYQNFIYDCGYDTMLLSHEFNLVQLDGKLLVQDAFMDMTIANADGSPKDFIQMLGEIKRGDFSNIKIMEESIASEYWDDSLKKEVLAIYCSDASYQAYLSHISITDNRIKIMLNRSYTFLTATMLPHLRPVFKAEGLSENFLSIYLKPMYLRNGNTGAQADSLFQVISAVTGSGLPD